MKKIIFLILISFFSQFLFCSEKNDNNKNFDSDSKNSENISQLFYSDTKPSSYFIAAGEIFYINLTVATLDYSIFKTEWTFFQPDRLKENFNQKWIWDQSSFVRNQIYHPIFGAGYYNAARSNGLSFLPSILYTAAGSFMWESFTAYGPSSINDFITTTIAGSITGEVSYRLGEELYSLFKPLGWIVNPVGALNDLLGLYDYGSAGKIHMANIKAGFGFSNYNVTENNLSKKENLINNFSFPAGTTELEVIYDNPYGHKTKNFFDQFDLYSGFSISPKNQLYYININGLLYGIPIYLPESFSTLGIGLNYNFFYSNGILSSVESTGFTFKNQFNFHESATFEYSFDTNFIFLSSVDNYYLHNKDSRESFSTAITDYTYNFGIELLLKAKLNSSLGTIFLRNSNQYFWNYNNSWDDEKKQSNTFLFNLEASYSYNFTEKISAGITDNLKVKIGFNKKTPDINQVLNNTELFICYKIK